MALQLLAAAALLLSALVARSVRPEPQLSSKLIAAAIIRTTHGA